MKDRRIVIRAADGQEIGHIDVSDVANTNTEWIFSVNLETYCDMGHLHVERLTQLPPWGGVLRVHRL